MAVVAAVPFILYLVRFCSSKSCKYPYSYYLIFSYASWGSVRVRVLYRRRYEYEYEYCIVFFVLVRFRFYTNVTKKYCSDYCIRHSNDTNDTNIWDLIFALAV